MESKYIQLYNRLLEQIENKKLQEGDKDIPSEKELMEKYNMSRDTVRKALNMLVQDGHIEKAKGKVATVASRNQFNFPISAIKIF